MPDAGHITEKQIHEALWHYYYDIEKTVGYLLATYVTKPKEKEQKKAAAGKKVTGGSCSFLCFADWHIEDLTGFAGGGFIFLTINTLFLEG